MNQVVLMGRLTRDPELRYTAAGTPVTSFTLAVDDGFGENKKTQFIDCVAWKNTAEFVTKYFIKGQMMAVTGRLQIRDWNDKEGNKRKSAEVVVENVYFTESKKASASNEGYMTPLSGEDFAELEDEDGDGLPF